MAGASDQPMSLNQWGREREGRMDAKSHILHGPMRQTVPTSPALVAKRRRAEARRLACDLAGEDIK